MSQRILVIGSSNVDFIMKVESLPQKGETVGGGLFQQTFGGKGANQAVGAARAGGEVWFMNGMGDDPFAGPMLASLQEAGVNTSLVSLHPGEACGAALIMIDAEGANCISVAPGANYALTPEMVWDQSEVLAESALVVLQCEVHPQTLYAAIEEASLVGTPVMLNLAPAIPFSADFFSKLAVLVVNEVEAEMVTGMPVTDPASARAAASVLLDKGVGMAVITLGKRGSCLARGDEWVECPAFAVEAVDTTAAGDIFCGALATALVEDQPLELAARFASAAAAISVTRLGAQASAPTRAEIEQFLTDHSK